MTTAVLALLLAARTFLFDAAPAEPAPVARATLVVETSTLREAGAGPAIADRVRASGAALRRAAAVAEGGGPTDPVVAVTVRPLRGEDIGYSSTIALRHAGRKVTTSRQRCSLCTEEELVARVEDSLARLAPQVRRLAAGR